LPELDRWCDGRRAAAAAYARAGLGEHVALPGVPPGADPAWHLFVVAHERADELAAQLNRAGIGARGYYRVPLHPQPAMAGTARPFPRALARSERYGIGHTASGRHRGAGLWDKGAGLVARSAQLTRWGRGRGFDLALGHGSNDVTVAAALLRIPSSTMFDYE